MSESTDYTVDVTRGEDGLLWASVRELPGCFASGATFDELVEALEEAVTVYLAPDEGDDVATAHVATIGISVRRMREAA